jgi:hypothetical protein
MMVSSERLGYSLGVGHFTNGFDPSNSSIPNPAQSMDDFYNRLERCGFTSISINAAAGDVEDVLREYGPFILTHWCQGFPYGTGWIPPNDPQAVHAIVITGVDSAVNSGTCWINNPWGNKDRAVPTSAVTTAISKIGNTRMIAYYRR